MSRIKINTGVKRYEIEDENGELLGVISINVSDFNIIDRIAQSEKKIMQIASGVQEKVKNMQTIEEKGKAMADADAEIKKELDYMFDSNVSEIVFGNKSCLSVCGGQLLITNFIEGIIPVIKHDLLAVRKEAENRMAVYLKEYEK